MISDYITLLKKKKKLNLLESDWLTNFLMRCYWLVNLIDGSLLVNALKILLSHDIKFYFPFPALSVYLKPTVRLGIDILEIRLLTFMAPFFQIVI